MTAKPIGSVFLGDVLRRRMFPSSGTPPSSPPATADDSSWSDEIDEELSSSPPAIIPQTPVRGSTGPPLPSAPALVQSQPPPPSPPPSQTPAPVYIAPAPARPRTPPPDIKPERSLELRVRWLEALLFGARADANLITPAERARKAAISLPRGHTLIRAAEDVQHKLDSAVEAHEGLRRFLAQYDQHATLLTPSFALSGTLPEASPKYEDMSPAEMDALLAEMEPDILSADRDLREIAVLEKKGVAGAGRLAEYEALQPRLEALLESHAQDVVRANELEARIAGLIEKYASHVDALSDLFVDWDNAIAGAESKALRLERETAERRRLGYE